MSIFSRKKFDKIKREEVVEAIIGLEKQEEDIIASFDESKRKLASLSLKAKEKPTEICKWHTQKKLKVFSEKMLPHQSVGSL